MKQIQEHKDNDFIVGQMLVEEIKQAKYNLSLEKVCYDLDIEVSV